jgi:pimeloyl-ACP methyl ester carboxylesterase
VSDVDDHTIALPDGRRLGVVAHGTPGGRPVVLLHGTPASRLGHDFCAAPARERGVQVWCVDRPGIGRSDPRPGYTFADFADDLAGLADVRGWERFPVIGYSAGGPHALASAVRHPDRVSAVGLMAAAAPIDADGIRGSMSPLDRSLNDLAVQRPRLAGVVFGAMGLVLRAAPGLLVRSATSSMSEGERPLVLERADTLAAMVRGAFQQGSTGVVRDYQLLGLPWDFSTDGISQRVHIWHGTADTVAPPIHASRLAALLPDATIHLVPDAGHVSIQNHFGAILDSVLDDVQS